MHISKIERERASERELERKKKKFNYLKNRAQGWIIIFSKFAWNKERENIYNNFGFLFLFCSNMFYFLV